MKINESILCAGYGGQGVMVLGKFLAESGMESDLNVTWLPSYGAEVRGGTAYAIVRISSAPISDPMEAHPSAAIIMNEPSLKKFEKDIISGGLLILNASMTELAPKRSDLKVISVPLTDEAIKLGNIKVANMIAAGVYASAKKIFDKKVMTSAIEKMAGSRKDIVEINIKALERGMELI